MVLIISGVMGMLGILAEGKTRQRSGLHTLVEVRGQVPQSEEYIQAIEDTTPNHETNKISKYYPNSIETQDGKLDERV